MPEDEMQKLFADVLVYANTHPETFKKEIAEMQFNKQLQPFPVVVEALAKDTDHWGNYFVEQMDYIFERAKSSTNPQFVVDHLIEYAQIERDTRPYIHQIVARLYKELFSDNMVTKSAAICMLPRYLKNPVIDNQKTMIRELQNKLINPKWRIRYIAFVSLKAEKLLPKGFQLSFADVVQRLYKGRPLTF
jgi:hypothetical protein